MPGAIYRARFSCVSCDPVVWRCGDGVCRRGGHRAGVVHLRARARVSDFAFGDDGRLPAAAAAPVRVPHAADGRYARHRRDRRRHRERCRDDRDAASDHDPGTRDQHLAVVWRRRRPASFVGMQAPELLGGRYELRGVLGRGGMAEVRDGWDTRLDRPVAIKLLYPVFTTQHDNRMRFEVEARAAAALNHPHIVSVHDSGEHAGTPYIVMERLSGQTLADVIAQGPLPQPQVRSILDDVLSALAVAHAAGILHRDIKPANILFSTSGQVKVADFGVAKSAASAHTQTGQIVGTMAYLSPDRITGRPASVADDLYAVGVVGYEALTARKPFMQEDIAPLARAITEDQPPPLTELRPDVDPRLIDVIERAMSR